MTLTVLIMDEAPKTFKPMPPTGIKADGSGDICSIEFPLSVADPTELN